MQSLRRESVLSTLGFMLVAGVFVFAVYIPQHKAIGRVKEEIAASERSIRDVPTRVAELESLRADINRRMEFVNHARPSVPVNPDVHGVIHQVAELARNCDLQVWRLEPQTGTMHESYQSLPFKLSFSGPYRSMLEFVSGLESSERLFHTQRFTIKQKNARFGSNVDGDMDFVIYVNHAKSNDFSKNNDSSSSTPADTKGGG